MSKSFEKIKKTSEKTLALAASIGALAIPATAEATAITPGATHGNKIERVKTVKYERKVPQEVKKWAKFYTERMNNRESFPLLNGRWIRTKTVQTGGTAASKVENNGGLAPKRGESWLYQVEDLPVPLSDPNKQLGVRELYDGKKTWLGKIVKPEGQPLEIVPVDNFDIRTDDLVLAEKDVRADGSAPILTVWAHDYRGLGTLPNPGSVLEVSADGDMSHGGPFTVDAGKDSYQYRIADVAQVRTTPNLPYEVAR